MKKLQKTKNPETGVVHGLSGRKVGPLQLVETICGVESGLVWTKAPSKKVTCTKCLSMLPRKYTEHCCDKMDYYLHMRCDQHSNPFDCPDSIISYDKKKKAYGIIIHDGSHSYYEIFFCPWCRTKL